MENTGFEPFAITPADSASARWERWIRRFDNFVVARDIDDDRRKKAMLLHYAGEAVFELSESVGVVDSDNYAETKDKLTAYFTPKRNEEYEVFVFRQSQQHTGETLDQFHARLQLLSKNCNFQDKSREIKSQIIQKCTMPKIREKGLSEATISLDRLLTYGRTLESTMHQSSVMGTNAASTTNVNAVSSDRHHHPRSRKQNRDWNSRSVGRQGAPPKTDENPVVWRHCAAAIPFQNTAMHNLVQAVENLRTIERNVQPGAKHVTNAKNLITSLECVELSWQTLIW